MQPFLRSLHWCPDRLGKCLQSNLQSCTRASLHHRLRKIAHTVVCMVSLRGSCEPLLAHHGFSEGFYAPRETMDAHGFARLEAPSSDASFSSFGASKSVTSSTSVIACISLSGVSFKCLLPRAEFVDFPPLDSALAIGGIPPLLSTLAFTDSPTLKTPAAAPPRCPPLRHPQGHPARRARHRTT